MIRHVSIPAERPAHVATVLAEIMGGRAYPFPGAVPGAFMAVAEDDKGTSIEVYPETMAGAPGEDGPVELSHNPEPPRFWPFHLLLDTPLSEAAILAIGAREGWRTARFGRGDPARPLFQVIEFWVENRFMIELANPEMLGDYLRLYQPGSFSRMFEPLPAV